MMNYSYLYSQPWNRNQNVNLKAEVGSLNDLNEKKIDILIEQYLDEEGKYPNKVIVSKDREGLFTKNSNFIQTTLFSVHIDNSKIF